MEDQDRYAIGQQDFKTLRRDGALYIDKTAFIEKIAKSNTKYYFLTRPRRFGKSLFLSTMKCFFEGDRELFKGLYIDSTDWDWEPCPVLRLDLNTDRYDKPNALDDVLETQFIDWEEKYGISEKMETYSQRFKTIIKTAHEKTGKQVVILVDEYDKPLVSNLRNTDNFEAYRKQVASIDMLIETSRYIYVIELKYNSTPEDALRQIDEKGYARKFTTDRRQLFKIGVNFSSESRRIEDWEIEL